MTLLVCAAALFAAGCENPNAAQGAKTGAVGGAVAGAVLGILSGGNVGASIAVGAATSAAAGAAVGAMTPAQSSQGTAAPPTDPKLAERQQALEKKIGPANFDAARMLALCRYDSAIELARNAYNTADTQERRGYALMIEAVASEERGDTATAAAVYPRLVEVDPALGSTDKARNAALSGVLKVQQVRKEYGYPPTCQ